MVSLESHLNALNFTAQLETVRDLLLEQHAGGVDKARANVTFWGSRVVTVDGFSGSVYLNNIVYKVLRLSEIGHDNDNVPQDALGEVRDKLREFYGRTDIEVTNSNCLTRFLVWIREFSFSSYIGLGHSSAREDLDL